jgi:hypothetical protein
MRRRAASSHLGPIPSSRAEAELTRIYDEKRAALDRVLERKRAN